MMNRRNIQERVDHIKGLLDPEKAKREKRTERSRGLVKGLAVGTLIGGLVGIFFAPDKGENTRKKTKEELGKAKDILETNFQEGKEKINGLIEDKQGIFSKKAIVVQDHDSYNDEVTEVDDEEDLDRD